MFDLQSPFSKESGKGLLKPNTLETSWAEAAVLAKRSPMARVCTKVFMAFWLSTARTAYRS